MTLVIDNCAIATVDGDGLRLSRSCPATTKPGVQKPH